MFVDQITIYAKAGDGGDGVTRWRHEKFKPMAGPSGGNGGRGGDIIMRAVRDVNLLAKYTGEKKFVAGMGGEGMGQSRFGKNGDDLIIEVPVGSVVKDVERGRVYEFMTEGYEEKIFKGGGGGLGNEHFKSSINRSPEESTKGRKGEEGNLDITLSLVVDVGIIGMPNAGKSTLLNSLTNAHSRVGDYPFTTLEPHLGDLYGYILADIPGLIVGASDGKGLGHTFLRHVTHTKMLLHLVSLEDKDIFDRYSSVRNELKNYSEDLMDKEEWIIFTKKDLVNEEDFKDIKNKIDKIENRVFVISTKTGENVKELHDALVQHLRQS
ncbi:MAG: GTPase ObgE [Candidatus Pacebacteria bacterium]|nr:GTPase ObgE [Candidatus Paceibacterota bacterium]